MVVNIATSRCDVYIGRRKEGMHYGNPFTFVKNDYGLLKVASREEAVACFESWIRGEGFEDVEPERRAWILQNLSTLNNKLLGCYCAPKLCHGEILETLLKEKP